MFSCNFKDNLKMTNKITFKAFLAITLNFFLLSFVYSTSTDDLYKTVKTLTDENKALQEIIKKYRDRIQTDEHKHFQEIEEMQNQIANRIQESQEKITTINNASLDESLKNLEIEVKQKEQTFSTKKTQLDSLEKNIEELSLQRNYEKQKYLNENQELKEKYEEEIKKTKQTISSELESSNNNLSELKDNLIAVFTTHMKKIKQLSEEEKLLNHKENELMQIFMETFQNTYHVIENKHQEILEKLKKIK